MSFLIVIPARMGATRLPGKPLVDIQGVPMIVRVARRAALCDGATVLIAAGEREIYDTVIAAGFSAILTDPDLPSGSDRAHIAAKTYDPEGKFDLIVNLQGDLPMIDPDYLKIAVAHARANPACDIVTLGAKITDETERNDPNVVKIIFSEREKGKSGRALYFTRATAPAGEGDLYHHIGIYVYRRAALDRFVSLPPSDLEKREKLEQLRALENDMRTDVVCVHHAPVGVDTPDDLRKVRELLNHE